MKLAIFLSFLTLTSLHASDRFAQVIAEDPALKSLHEEIEAVQNITSGEIDNRRAILASEVARLVSTPETKKRLIEAMLVDANEFDDISGNRAYWREQFQSLENAELVSTVVQLVTAKNSRVLKLIGTPQKIAAKQSKVTKEEAEAKLAKLLELEDFRIETLENEERKLCSLQVKSFKKDSNGKLNLVLFDKEGEVPLTIKQYSSDDPIVRSYSGRSVYRGFNSFPTREFDEILEDVEIAKKNGQTLCVSYNIRGIKDTPYITLTEKPRLEAKVTETETQSEFPNTHATEGNTKPDAQTSPRSICDRGEKCSLPRLEAQAKALFECVEAAQKTVAGTFQSHFTPLGRAYIQLTGGDDQRSITFLTEKGLYAVPLRSIQDEKAKIEDNKNAYVETFYRRVRLKGAEAPFTIEILKAKYSSPKGEWGDFSFHVKLSSETGDSVLPIEEEPKESTNKAKHLSELHLSISDSLERFASLSEKHSNQAPHKTNFRQKAYVDKDSVNPMIKACENTGVPSITEQINRIKKASTKYHSGAEKPKSIVD